MKKIRQILTIAVLFFFTNAVCFGQQWTKELRAFKTADFTYRSFDLQGDIDRLFSNSESSSEQDSSLTEIQHNDNESSINLNPVFYFKKGTRASIETLRSNFNLSNNFQKYSSNNKADPINTNNFNMSNRFNLGLGIDYDCDYYYKKNDKVFFTYGGSFDYNYRDQRVKTGQESETSIRNDPFNPIGGGIHIGHGHGRLENIEDLVEAIYILTELSDHNLMTKAIDQEILQAFADRITEVKNERYFDYRIYRKKSMETLVNKLKEMGLIEKESVSVYNTIADYHFHANLNERESGQKLEYSLGSELSYSKNKQSYTDNNQTTVESSISSSLQANLSYYNVKPLSLKWQQNVSLSSEYRIGSDKSIEDDPNGTDENQEDTKNFLVTGSLSYQYFPDTRTSISVGLYESLYYFYSEKQPNKVITRSRWNNSIGLYTQVNYYISERFRINGYASIYHTNQSTSISGANQNYYEKNKNAMFSSSLGASIIYSIF